MKGLANSLLAVLAGVVLFFAHYFLLSPMPPLIIPWLRVELPAEIFAGGAVSATIFLQTMFLPESGKRLLRQTVISVAIGLLLLPMLRLLAYPAGIVIVGIVLTTSLLLAGLLRKKGMFYAKFRQMLLILMTVLVIPSSLLLRQMPEIEIHSKEECSVEVTSMDIDKMNAVWEELNRPEKVQALYTIMAQEADKLKIETPSLQIRGLRISSKGEFRHKENLIVCNSRYFDTWSFSQSVEVVLHELKHSHQYRIMDGTVPADPVFAKRLKLALDSYTAKEYRSNLMEIDARAFSERILKEYGLKDTEEAKHVS